MSTPELRVIVNEDGALVLLIKHWCNGTGPLFNALLGVDWLDTSLYGKATPRRMFFLGDSSGRGDSSGKGDSSVKGDSSELSPLSYKGYGRSEYAIHPWVNDGSIVGQAYKVVRRIRDAIVKEPALLPLLAPILSSSNPTPGPTSLQYNACLINYYRNGTDSISSHSDKEALGPGCAVATVSLGATRTFVLKKKIKVGHRFPTIKVALEDGDLCLMAGRCQELWTHAIPKELTVTEGRMSLTYRWVQN